MIEISMVLIAAVCLTAYRLGLRDGMRNTEGLPPEPMGAVFRHRVRREPDKRWERLRANIEAYDGTARGQKKLD